MRFISLDFLSFSLDQVVWLIAAIILCAFIVHTLLIFYHWKKYAPDGKVSRTFWTLYLASTAVLIIIMMVSALALRY